MFPAGEATAIAASAIDSGAWVLKPPKGKPPLAFYALARPKAVEMLAQAVPAMGLGRNIALVKTQETRLSGVLPAVVKSARVQCLRTLGRWRKWGKFRCRARADGSRW